MPKKLKLRRASEHAAYLVADGITAAEADAQGLIAVENDALGNAIAFGRYADDAELEAAPLQREAPEDEAEQPPAA